MHHNTILHFFILLDIRVSVHHLTRLLCFVWSHYGGWNSQGDSLSTPSVMCILLYGRARLQVSSDETERLIKMEETLHQRVIGQEEAIVAISRAIRRARVGLKNPNRPIASFIFSGPTGVGKSELAKTLATYYFGSQDAMVRLDMSEFMERHTVSKLIGSPPGMSYLIAYSPQAYDHIFH